MSVVIVGAGLAGLTAACDLLGRGVPATVLEARDRVGGRTHGIEVVPGAWADAGGAYLGDRHTELHKTLADLGLKTAPTAMVGHSRFALGRGDGERPSRFPPLDAVALGDLFDKLEELAAAVVTEAPWTTPNASTWDSLTAADWAAINLTHRDAQLFFPLFLGEMMAADPADISVLHMAFYLRSGGGIRYLNAFEGGAQQDRVDGGAHQIAQGLAARLGHRVRLRSAVTAIHQDSEGATVYCGDLAIRCDAVIVAVPPLLADAIDYHPALPVRRSSDHTSPGAAVKVQLIYPEPLWRTHGMSGWSVSADGPLLSTVDDSPADASAGILTGFVTGREAYRFSALPAHEQRAEAIGQITRLFPRLPAPLAVHVTDWVGERYSRGCYAALLGPGDWVRHGPHLAAAHGRVHWAGTETSTEFFGLMEGAIRSGHRVAAEFLTSYEPLGRSR